MKKLWDISKIYIIFSSFMIVNTIAALFLNKTLFFISLALTVLSTGLAVFRSISIKKRLSSIITSVSNDLSTSESKALWQLKIPVLIATQSGEVIWYNNRFETIVTNATDIVGQNVTQFAGSDVAEQLETTHQSELILDDKIFSIFLSAIERSSGSLNIYYLFDQTNYKKTVFEYSQSRPAVAIIALDNLDEITKTARDSEIASFRSAIQTKIEGWTSNSTGIIRKLSGDRYLMVLEERHLNDMMEQRFNILDQVREIQFGDSNPTLSIGVGRGAATMSECEEMASQALDMALGRGGDQAVVKSPNNDYKFFGGVSGAVEKRTKVRARIVASALREMILSSDNVIIMGHKFADLDCFGACFGLYSAVVSLNRNACIVMDKEKSMATPLLNRINSISDGCNVVSGNDLLPLIDRNTLLIITDVHRPSFLENEEIYKKCEVVVVIDHHRMSVDHIDKAAIFYHETAASSTCEMVTELLQYINSKSVCQVQAEALLSGIMLDTRNFVLHTGVRTFEASAFLRNRGADPVAVKKLFSGSMPSYRQRANIVATAELYGDCAIAENRINDENTRIATAQAADELLGISGVQSSYVLCRIDNQINISARSLGSVNVQLIMETLGGGGHRTMAACQISSSDFEQARLHLIAAIDEYKSNI